MAILTLDAHIDIEVTFLTPERPGVLGYEKLVTLEKMEKGGLDAAVFVIFIEQDKEGDINFQKAHDLALQKFEIIHEGIEKKFSDKISLATEPADVTNIHNSGKKVAIIGIENGYPIGKNIRNVKKFYDLGCRYITLAHAGNNHICSSSVNIERTARPDAGLTEFGKDVISEMNRIGMIVDVSHVSKQTTFDVARLSKAPIIASHTNCRALNKKQTRIMSDEELLAVKETGGVVHIVGLGFFLKEDPPAKKEAIIKLRQEFNMPKDEWNFFSDFMKSPDDVQSKYKTRIELLQHDHHPLGVSDLVDHIDHAVQLIGIDHVGISSDFFDSNYSLVGWKDASETANVTLELVKRGYSENDIKKLWSANFLRVWNEVAPPVTEQVGKNKLKNISL